MGFAIFLRTSYTTTWSPWWRDVSKPLGRRRNNTIATWPPNVSKRHPRMAAIGRATATHGPLGVALSPSTDGRRHGLRGARSKAFHRRCHTKDSHWRVWGRFRRHGRTCRRRRFCRNQIKASLRAFQRWKVKVLGFGVKARLRPHRMASRGCSDPFALIGAIGKACGEAWVCVFFWVPPGGVGVCAPCCCGVLVGFVCWWGWCVGCVRVLAVLARWLC